MLLCKSLPNNILKQGWLVPFEVLGRLELVTQGVQDIAEESENTI